MSANDPTKKLRSDESPAYSPRYKKDMYPGEKERAAKFLGWPNFYELEDGLEDIRNGADTRALWRLATTTKDVWLAIRTVINLAFWVEGKIVPSNDYEQHPEFEDIDKKLIAFLNQVFENQKYTTMPRLLKDLAFFGKICGYSVAEKVWAPSDGLWICDYKIKRSFDFTTRVDKYGNKRSVWYYPRGREFHPDAFLWAPWGVFGGNWLGQSDIIAVRSDILTMNSMQKALDVLSVQLSKRPVVDVYDADNISAAEETRWTGSVDALFNGKGNAVLHAPSTRDDKGNLSPSFELKIPETREGANAIRELSKAISEKKMDIKNTLGIPNDMGLTNVPGGSWAKAKEEFNLLVSMAEEVQEYVQEVVDKQIITELIGFNWPKGTLPAGYCLPKYRYNQIEEKYEKDKAEFISELTTAGYMSPTDLEDLNLGREMAGLPPKAEVLPTPEVEPVAEPIAEPIVEADAIIEPELGEQPIEPTAPTYGQRLLNMLRKGTQ